MRVCSSCNWPILYERASCPICGKMIRLERICLSCSKLIPRLSEFCIYCGRRVGIDVYDKLCPSCYMKCLKGMYWFNIVVLSAFTVLMFLVCILRGIPLISGMGIGIIVCLAILTLQVIGYSHANRINVEERLKNREE